MATLFVLVIIYLYGSNGHAMVVTGQSGEHSLTLCDSEPLGYFLSARESGSMLRNYRNSMTDHISHFFPCCVNLGSSLLSNCLWENKGSKLIPWDGTGLGTPVSTLAWYTLSVTHRSRRALLRRSDLVAWKSRWLTEN